MILSESLIKITKPHLLIGKVLWVAFTLSIAFLFCLSLFLPSIMQGNDTMLDADLVNNILLIAAVVLAVFSLFLRKHFLSDSFISTKLNIEPDLNTLAMNLQTREVDEERLATLKNLGKHEQKVYSLIISSTKPLIIIFAINEAIMILGFVLAILTKDSNAAMPFAIAAIALNIINYPKHQKVMEQAIKRCRVM